MKLSPDQFDQLFENNRLMISLIGMSNVGKTYWSTQLQTLGFDHMNCDDMIGSKLGYAGISDVANWMGQPYEPRFLTNQAKYLAFEQNSMEAILAQINQGVAHNTVIDTTGSVVHTGQAICNDLKKYSLVIAITATADLTAELFQQYIKHPKPVVFGDMFQLQPGETHLQALGRCYQALLAWRSTLYLRYADVVLPYTKLNTSLTPDQFITLIKQAL